MTGCVFVCVCVCVCVFVCLIHLAHVPDVGPQILRMCFKPNVPSLVEMHVPTHTQSHVLLQIILSISFAQTPFMVIFSTTDTTQMPVLLINEYPFSFCTHPLRDVVVSCDCFCITPVSLFLTHSLISVSIHLMSTARVRMTIRSKIKLFLRKLGNVRYSVCVFRGEMRNRKLV